MCADGTDGQRRKRYAVRAVEQVCNLFVEIHCAKRRIFFFGYFCEEISGASREGLENRLKICSTWAGRCASGDGTDGSGQIFSIAALGRSTANASRLVFPTTATAVHVMAFLYKAIHYSCPKRHLPALNCH
jgi:hypothetical protein